MLFLTLKVLALPCCKEQWSHTPGITISKITCILLRWRRLNLSEIQIHPNNPIRQSKNLRRPEDVLLVVYKAFWWSQKVKPYCRKTITITSISCDSTWKAVCRSGNIHHQAAKSSMNDKIERLIYGERLGVKHMEFYYLIVKSEHEHPWIFDRWNF